MHIYTPDLRIASNQLMKALRQKSPMPKVLALIAVRNAIYDLAELLLIHDGVVIPIHGENFSLAVLANFFEEKGLDTLLQTNAIRFFFETQNITKLEKNIKHVNPLQSGNLTSTPHTIPLESAQLGLAANKNLDKSQRANIAKIASQRYDIPKKGLSAEGVQYAHAGAISGKFSNLGLAKQTDITQLSMGQKDALIDIANSVFRFAIFADKNYCSFNDPGMKKWNSELFKEWEHLGILKSRTDILTSLEGLPTLAHLIKSGDIALADIPKIRESKDGKEFRKWLYKAHLSGTQMDVTQEYIRAIGVNPKNIKKDRSQTLAIQSLVTVFGGAAGTLIGGGAGTVVGGAIGVGFGVLDEIVYKAMKSGWTPRHFFTQQIQTRYTPPAKS